MKISPITGVSFAMVQMKISADPMTNAKRFVKKALKAAALGADVIVGSEMLVMRYLSGDLYEEDEFVTETAQVVDYVARKTAHLNAVIVFGGIGLEPTDAKGEDGRRRKYNAAFVLQNGKLVRNTGTELDFAIKALHPNYRIFDDARHFFCLRKLAMERGVELTDLLRPFEVTIRGVVVKLGVILCEDMWDQDYAQKPSQILAENGADILINLSCSNWSWQKNRKRDEVIRAICLKTGLPFIYVNNVGCQNNGKNFITFDGASTFYNRLGNIIAMTKRYAEEVNVVTYYDDLKTFFRKEVGDVEQLYKAIVVATEGFLETLPRSLRKVVIGVSGGVDSALSVAFFAHLLGPENVIAVNMPYKHFNSDETKDDAKEMCRRLGVEYRVCLIDDMVDAATLLSGALVGTGAHKTTQAIQRMALLASIAAQEKAFFTCNANMTEIAFGYGTLNGDMRGAFAPWMNLLKQDVYRLADYLNRAIYRREVILQSIIDRPPMDELTAAGAGERKDPFHYGSVTENGYHDQMVRAIVAFRHGRAWFLERYLDGTLEAEFKLVPGTLKKLFPTGREFAADLTRCFALMQAAVFKHVQSVPGPLVDKRSYGWDFRESIVPQVVVTTRAKQLIATLKRRNYPVYLAA